MENCIIIDYLSATLDCRDDLPFLYEPSTIYTYFSDVLGISIDKFEVSNGVRGFDQRYWFDGINIFTPSDKMPFCWLEMSGCGCRAFESYGVGDWWYLLRNLNDWCRFRRIDLAYDDHAGILPMSQMIQDTYLRQYVSKARKHKLIIGLDDTSSDLECSIYHGSESSDVMLRIYDKAMQLDRVGEHWIRSELQLRGDRAQNTVQALLDHHHFGDTYFGILNNYFRYVEPCDSDSNKWRWPVKDYWSEFIKDSSRIEIASKKGIEYNLQSLDHYVFHQAGNSILTALKIYGLDGFVSRLKDQRPFINNPAQIALLEKLAAEGRLCVSPERGDCRVFQ